MGLGSWRGRFRREGPAAANLVGYGDGVEGPAHARFRIVLSQCEYLSFRGIFFPHIAAICRFVRRGPKAVEKIARKGACRLGPALSGALRAS